MKPIFRRLAWLLVLSLLPASMSSCGLLFERVLPSDTTAQILTTPLPVESPSQEPAQTEASTSEEEIQRPSELQYTLTQADLDEFDALLQKVEEHFGGTIPNGTEEALLTELEAAYDHLVTQEQLAYIYYCLDQNDPSMSERYLFASAAVSDGYRDYMEMCTRLREADTATSKLFFEDWTEAELSVLERYDPEMTKLDQENDELLVEYRDLPDDNLYADTPALYLQMLQNNNRIAEMNGYENYWEYAYAEVYGRDYDRDFLQSVRENVISELLPLMEEVDARLQGVYAAFPTAKQTLIWNLLFEDYDRYATAWVKGYTDSYPEQTGAMLHRVIDANRSFFTDSATAYAGAFTAFLQEPKQAVCYFGPGYQEAFTVMHEMGHFYAAEAYGGLDIPLDLAEVHSQGNEWIFCAYLTGELSADVAEFITLYQLYSCLSSIVCTMIVDEFEELCYTQRPATASALEACMDQVMLRYGGSEWLEQYVTDMQGYWRYVVLESPVYYISYSVSGIAALQLYALSMQDYSKAQEYFLALCEPENIDLGFLGCLEEVGLKLPNDVTIFEELAALITD